MTAAPASLFVEQVPPSSKRRLSLKTTIGGDIAPKSIVASGTGLFFAQNMMYRHWIRGVGRGPRHLVVAPRGRYLYATLNAEGTVAKIDLRRDAVVGKATTGLAPRSMAISGDGRSLYVVNYSSNTMSKVRARDLRILQTVKTQPFPIGIAYDAALGELWVACYSGTILVFDDA